MRKIKKYLFCLLVVFLFILQAESVFAELEADYPVRVWSADNMEVGNVTGVDGLEFLQPTDETAAKVMVKAEGRLPFKNAIKTGGSASLQGRYLPKTRALKFTITEPCNISIYAYGASSEGEVTLKISDGGKIVKTFATQHSVLGRYMTYLDSPGTYYIFGNGSLGICEVTVGYIHGDADLNFDRDWNDMRLLTKVSLGQLYLNEMASRNADIDKDSVITANDMALLQSYINSDGVSVREKAKLVDHAVWNANDMAVGNPETYKGLEFVYVDGNISNNTIGVINRESSYVSPNGEVKNYTKCIQTDGDSGNGYGNYPVSRAVKFNLNAEAYVTLYVSTGSSKPTQHKVAIMDADRNKVAEFNIDKNIGCYTTKLSGNETYFVYSDTGKLRIYEIDVNADMLKDIPQISKSINVTAGQNYIYTLTVNNAAIVDNALFSFKYNSSDVEPVSFGEVKIADLKHSNESGLIDVQTSDGKVIFKTKNLTNGESGILTEVELKAKRNCNTTITLSVQGE